MYGTPTQQEILEKMITSKASGFGKRSAIDFRTTCCGNFRLAIDFRASGKKRLIFHGLSSLIASLKLNYWIAKDLVCKLNNG
ncbi:hypothetical protein L1987_45485 [Smallanthus sonchifolius]|uniref:Uncharacterized protein n=1 Tax=Smallanthus sonchifolius TaxID=185202 RepID=A0ACB9FWZ5_9ASTR|nr:hypothetical protein L1987_45485 [Smallanthus sonchifolius]